MSFGDIVEIAATLLSVVLLVVGFRKDDRKILLAAWICLFIALAASGGFTEGFAEGYESARNT